jgi:hypothetical protein
VQLPLRGAQVARRQLDIGKGVGHERSPGGGATLSSTESILRCSNIRALFDFVDLERRAERREMPAFVSGENDYRSVIAMRFER